MKFSDYVIYVDESGDHGLVSIDPEFPIFVLAFCIFKKNDYVHRVVPALQDLKFKWFGHDAVVLHEREIRQNTGSFSFLFDRSFRIPFVDELSFCLSKSRMVVISAVIDKRKLKDSVEGGLPEGQEPGEAEQDVETQAEKSPVEHPR